MTAFRGDDILLRRIDHDDLPDPPGVRDVPTWGVVLVLAVLALPLLLYAIGAGMWDSLRRLWR